MKYLITGGCGFLGSNIADALIGQKETPVIVDNLSRLGSKNNLEWLRSRGDIRFFQGDVTDNTFVDKVVRDEKPDVIFHFAGQVAMTTSIQNPRLDFQINALGTLNLLEAVRQYSPSAAFIFSSTNKVYGDLEYCRVVEEETRYSLTDYPEGVPENIQLSFQSPYGCSKGAADQYVLDYAHVFGLKTIVFRHSSMYGGRQFSTYDQGWIGWFCQQALLQAGGKGEEFTVSGNGKQVRDVLHGDDMVALYLTAAQKIDLIAGQAFNIGGGMANSLSILELFGELESILSIRLKWHSIAPRESDQKVFVADLAKISRATGWKPMVDKSTGIKKMIEWLRAQGSGGK